MKKIHFYIITSQGGIADGVRPPQEGNIIAAVERPKTKVIGENPSGLPVEAFDNLLAKATALGFGLNRGHGFTDGNKRTSLMAMVLMLYVNGANMIVPPAMTKYLLMVADNKISEKEFLGVVKRYAYSNRIIGVWKRIRYYYLPEAVYDFFYYFPGLYRYSEQMDLDWLGAGEERARDKFWDEMEYWEKQGFPKDDVELEIEGTLSELKEQGILTED